MENNDENKEELDNKKLMDDLNELEDDENSKKAQFKQKIKNNKENIIIVIAIILLILCIIIYYNNRMNNEDDVISFEDDYSDYLSDFDEYILEEKYNDTDYESIDDNEISNIENYNEEDIYSEENNVYSNSDEYEEERVKARFEAQKSNILVSNTAISVNKKIIATITNNNAESIYGVSVYAVFYNEANQIMEITTDVIGLLKPNSSYYWKLEDTPEGYTRYDIFIKKDVYMYEDDFEYRNEDILYTDTLNGRKVTIDVNNTTEEDIDYVEFSIIYYDSQNNILDLETVSGYDLAGNGNIKVVGSGVWNSTEKKDVQFDRYEIVLNYAA